jgi:hypothetical protein
LAVILKDGLKTQAESALAQAREETLGTARAAERVIEPLARDLAAAREEIERLKVCGNCGGSGYHGGAFGCFRDVDYLFLDTDPTDHCHHDDSRWTPRTEGGP